MKKISESGIISDDGKLRLPMFRVNAFCLANKGKRVIVRIEAAAPGSTELQRAYYYNYVVPTIAAALYEQGTRKSEMAVDKWLVDEYPGDKEESEIGLGVEVTEARQFNKSQMFDFLEWLKQYAAENLYVYVEDPRTL